MYTSLHSCLYARRLIPLESCECTASLRSICIARHIFDDPRRIASNDFVWRDVLRHNTPGSHSRTLPYPHARQNNHISPNPAILLDPNLLPKLRPAHPTTHLRVERVPGRVERHIWCQQCPRADRHEASVGDGAVGIDEDPFAQLEVCAVVDANWRHDVGFRGEEGRVFFFCWQGWREGGGVGDDAGKFWI
jgi:hypothetical protein